MPLAQTSALPSIEHFVGEGAGLPSIKGLRVGWWGDLQGQLAGLH